jgi:dolichol-phosphate mannosyltransferase
VNQYLTLGNAIYLFLVIFQLPAIAILLTRLLKGPGRQQPVSPELASPEILGSVSVVVPTLNEVERITPLLLGLSKQSYEVREIIIVDSNSVDGTRELVKNAQEKDPRFNLITDDPLPNGWVGRPWALHNGFLATSQQSKWFLGMDADTIPHPGLISGLVKVAEAQNYDLVSLSPKFILKYPGESWLQPSLLMTLLYRFDPAGINSKQPQRVMANGQCYLCRREVLEALSGYTSAKASFCDDVTLARNIAAQGYKVGFLDGSKVLEVRMYEGALETWSEWGRSLDLKDASSPTQIWGDLWLLTATQGLPLFVVLTYILLSLSSFTSVTSTFTAFSPLSFLLWLNLFLLLIRFALLFAISSSYQLNTAKGGWLFWLSPLADPLAVLRIFISAFSTPKKWRGREYGGS